jgi:bifunctional enzyme CysN/CysC/sulfate adenylyltransferase subunit 1
LLQYLETVPLTIREAAAGPLRFPVQLVVRPNAEFRGFAGRVERGELHPGMRVKALPSGRVTTVKSIVTYGGELTAASFPLSVTVELEDDIDLSRGEMLIGEAQSAPQVSTAFRAMVVWMYEQPLTAGRTYLAKHTTRTVRATVRKIRYGVDIQSAERCERSQVQMNDIAEIDFETSLPLFFDAYAENREMGALILIDPLTNATVGAAMILDAVASEETASSGATGSAFVWLRNLSGEAEALREALRERGRAAVIVDDPLIAEASLAGVVRALQLAEVTAISARAELGNATMEAVREVVGERFFESREDASVWLEACVHDEEIG